MATATREARYILADVAANANKFWSIALHDSRTCVRRWGRVGEAGSEKEFQFATPVEAERFFESKRNEKERKGYLPQRTLGGHADSGRLVDVALEQIDADSDETRRLVARLARANVHSILAQTSMEYDESRGAFSTPLGIVTRDALIEARGLLNHIANHVNVGAYDDPELLRALSDYLMLVPRDLGRRKPDPRNLFPDRPSVQAQNMLLDNLEASLDTTLAQTDKSIPVERLFQARLHNVEDRAVVERLKARYRQTAQSCHGCFHLEVARIFEVEIDPMRDAFQRRGRRIGNVMELWHGTRTGNLLSILRSGFVVPPRSAPHVTGRMFGDGIYFSDQSTKSLNYAHGYWFGAREPRCYMFLCDVAMGRPFTPPGPLPIKPFWCHSIYAKAGISGVANNEMVVFDAAQVNPRYLIEFASMEAKAC